MFNPDNLSDEELATCVDTYVQRAINWARGQGCNKSIHIFISGMVGSGDNAYTITHTTEVGSAYSGEHAKGQSNNAIATIKQLVPAMAAVELSEPTHVRTLLSAPIAFDDESIDEDRPY